MNKIYIKGNIPSSKNSKVFTGRFLVNSKTVQKYLKNYEKQWEDEEIKNIFLEEIKDKDKPYKLHVYFIRDSKRKFDYINALQLPLDIMVKNNWIEDDNADVILPVFDGYHIDKEQAGIIFYVE